VERAAERWPGLSPAARARKLSRGSASLHPGRYAVACFAGFLNVANVSLGTRETVDYFRSEARRLSIDVRNSSGVAERPCTHSNTSE
jgi:hypothetical protein